MYKSLLAACLLAGGVAMAAPASAQLYTFTGVSSGMFDPDTGEAEDYVVKFTFDSAIAPVAVFNETTWAGTPTAYNRAFYYNIVGFSVTGPRYNVSVDTGAASISNLASDRFRDGNSGMFVMGGSEGTTIGYSLGFLYFANPGFSSTGMPLSLDIANAWENGFNLTEYYYDGDPADEIITSVERLNFRFASGSIVAAPTSAVPEPASWAMVIGGLGLIGGAMRRRNVRTTVSFA